MKKAFTLIAILFFSVVTSFSQNDDERNEVIVKEDPNKRAPSLSVGVIFGSPQGQFKDVYDGTPVGLGGALLFNLGQSPLEVGGSFSWQNMGTNSEDIDIFIGEDEEGDDIYEYGTMDVNNNIYSYHAIGRFKPFSGRIQVYGDGIAGFNTYTTKTIIESDKDNGNQPKEERKDERNFTTSYGWAAGLKLRLTPAIAVEARFSSLQGGKTAFVDPNSVLIDSNGNLDYEVRESNTNIRTYQIGISFEF